MQIDRLIEFIQSSFLKPLLCDDDITDISYNGKNLFYMSTSQGRKQSDIELTKENAKSFTRQIANFAEKTFSYQSPFLDVSFGKYRFNATHDSVSKVRNEGAINFSIRIAGDINKPDYIDEKLEKLLRKVVNDGKSIIISGKTGTGKTQLQKYLISLFTPNTRVVVIDNVEELTNCDYSSSLDFNFWCSDEYQEEKTPSKLIKNALRCNPDWLILAEARGPEMVDVLNSAMTGHPIITTIHSFDNSSTPHRIARLIQIKRNEEKIDNILDDIYHHFKIFIHLSIKINKRITRYIDEISEVDDKGHWSSLFKA